VTQIPKNGPSGGYLGSFALSIPKASKNKEAGWKLISYFFDHYAEIRKVFPAPVTNRAALAKILSDPAVTDRQKQMFRVFNEGSAAAIPMPPVAQQSALMDTLEVAISSLMSRTKSPEDVLKEAANQMRQILGQ
jgi:ABC-type glycerol-3-phosphate transport system substrate-binding protein